MQDEQAVRFGDDERGALEELRREVQASLDAGACCLLADLLADQGHPHGEVAQILACTIKEAPSVHVAILCILAMQEIARGRLPPAGALADIQGIIKGMAAEAQALAEEDDDGEQV